VRIATVHFDTGLMLPRGGADIARTRQAHALAEALASSMPVIVGGDFNTEWSVAEPAVAVLSRAFPDAKQPAVDTWRGPLGLRRQLDYVFARLGTGTLAVARYSDQMGSDHFPLITMVPTAALADGLSSSADEASTPFADEASAPFADEASTPFAVDPPARTQPQGGAG
jgi:endonuclease/exonuclease/phosphatase family metal-dependent hydrolase